MEKCGRFVLSQNAQRMSKLIQGPGGKPCQRQLSLSFRSQSAVPHASRSAPCVPLHQGHSKFKYHWHKMPFVHGLCRAGLASRKPHSPTGRSSSGYPTVLLCLGLCWPETARRSEPARRRDDSESDDSDLRLGRLRRHPRSGLNPSEHQRDLHAAFSRCQKVELKNRSIKRT